MSIRIFTATGNAINGLRLAYSGEWTFRVELVVTLIVAPFSFVLGTNAGEVALLLATLLLVLVMELVNTAIEKVVDRIGLEKHPLSKEAKDLGAAAVLMAVVISSVVWGVMIFDFCINHLT